MYKVNQFCFHIPDAIPSLKSLVYIHGTNPISNVQKELVVAIDTTNQLYYSDVVNPTSKDPNQLETLSNRTMDAVRKEHMTTFHKWLHVCDPSLNPKFLQEVQIHYDMNPKLEMLTKKLQMFVSACVTMDQKTIWLKQWNQLGVIREAQKFLK
jgi:hypothetical protein